MEEVTARNINYAIGYLVLVAGITIIILCIANGYGLFSGSVVPITIFSFDGISLDLGKAMSANMPEQFQVATENGSFNQQIFSKDMVNQPLNLTMHLFFLWFFASMGQKLAQLGVTLVKGVSMRTGSSVS